MGLQGTCSRTKNGDENMHNSDPHSGNGRQYVVSTRTMEVVVALAFMALAVVVMWDSYRIGAGWAAEGPLAGYFPFRVGAIMFVVSLVTLCVNLFAHTPDLTTFVERSQLWLVLQVLIPTAIFVAAIAYLGIYIASGLFIGIFMGWLGRYPIHKILPVAILVPLALFFMFEVWFLVPLPKGPVEAYFGY